MQVYELWKTCYVSKIFKNFGFKLKFFDSIVELFIFSSFKVIEKFGCDVPFLNNVIYRDWTNKFSKSNLLQMCYIYSISYFVKTYYVWKVSDGRAWKSKAKRKCVDFFMI